MCMCDERFEWNAHRGRVYNVLIYTRVGIPRVHDYIIVDRRVTSFYVYCEEMKTWHAERTSSYARVETCSLQAAESYLIILITDIDVLY